MCSINGITIKNKELVERMNLVTAHRGPDGSQVWESEEVTLGHNRLSIIDVRDIASQPFVSDDGRYVIVFNGELYNFKDLRKELSQFTYRTEGDTEVLLNAYRAWGPHCVKRFNGMFAFAIWDTIKKELFMARDQIGIKPLYYAEYDGAFIFSSEIKAILESGIPRRLHQKSFSHYMRLLYTPGEETLFEGVRRLNPGHTLVVKQGKTFIEKYYQAPEASSSVLVPVRETRSNIIETLDRAVSQQLVADVPVGVYLSGGIDSTAILDSVSRVHAHIDTFSVGFDLESIEESEKFNADLKLAETTARHYGTEHHAYILQSNDVISLLEKYIWHMDEPVANLTSLAQLKLAECAKRDVSVVLGGDGGDELFGGYARHRLAKKLQLYWMLPKALRVCAPERLRRADFDTWAERYLFFLAQKDSVLKRLCVTACDDATVQFFNKRYFEHTTRSTFLDAMMYADMDSWLVNESLLRSDKMAMAYGLEQRVPLLDIDLVALSRSIPHTQKITYTETKKIFKDALRERLPAYIFDQPKRGWISPGAKWIRRPDVAAYIKTVLSKGYYSETSGLFNWSEIEKMYESHLDRSGYYLTPLWSVITFQVWARRFEIKVK